MYNHILVCFDHSDGSRKALNKGIELCKHNQDCHLSVVQVINETPQPIDSQLPETEIGKNRFAAFPRLDGLIVTHIPASPVINHQPIPAHHHQNNLSHIIKQIVEPNGIPVNYDILEGNTALSICEYAELHQIDLIVVGHNEKGILKKIFLSSTGENILKNSDQDLLVVK